MIVSCFITELRRFETVEVAAGVQSLDGLTTEVDLAAAVILDDVGDRGAGARGRYAAPLGRCGASPVAVEPSSVGEPSSTESTST
jgi:hypothetical protein